MWMSSLKINGKREKWEKIKNKIKAFKMTATYWLGFEYHILLAMLKKKNNKIKNW